MVLTTNQRNQVSRTNPGRRPALIRFYNRQNANARSAPSGRSRIAGVRFAPRDTVNRQLPSVPRSIDTDLITLNVSGTISVRLTHTGNDENARIARKWIGPRTHPTSSAVCAAYSKFLITACEITFTATSSQNSSGILAYGYFPTTAEVPKRDDSLSLFRSTNSVAGGVHNTRTLRLPMDNVWRNIDPADSANRPWSFYIYNYVKEPGVNAVVNPGLFHVRYTIQFKQPV